jgi:hypothetical protein
MGKSTRRIAVRNSRGGVSTLFVLRRTRIRLGYIIISLPMVTSGIIVHVRGRHMGLSSVRSRMQRHEAGRVVSIIDSFQQMANNTGIVPTPPPLRKTRRLVHPVSTTTAFRHPPNESYRTVFTAVAESTNVVSTFSSAVASCHTPLMSPLRFTEIDQDLSESSRVFRDTQSV